MDVQNAMAEEHRAKAWEHRMRAFKELTIACFMLFSIVVFYAFVMRVWHLLPR